MDNPVLTAMSAAINQEEPTTEVEQIEQVESVEKTKEQPEPENTEEEESFEEKPEENEPTTDDTEGEETEDDGEDFGEGNEWLSEGDTEDEEVRDTDKNFDGISEALGLGGFNDEQSVIDEVKSIAKERDELRKAVEDSKGEGNFANDDIKRANELAKSGGDFNSYLQLSQIDYEQIDDDTLLMEGLIRPSFKTEDEANEYFNGMTEPQKKMEAQRFRTGLVQEQTQKKQEIIKAANDKRKSVNDGITKVLKGTSEIFGMKLSSADKKKTFGKLTSEKGIMNDVFYDKKGNLDYNKMVKTAYLLENFETIIKSAITKSRNQATKEVLDEATNVNLGKKSKKVEKKPTIERSPLESYMDGLKSRGR